MTTRAEYQSSWSRNAPDARTSSYVSHDAGTGSSSGSIGQAMNSMITAPFWMTAAGINLMTSGMQALGQSMGAGSSAPSSSGGHGNGGSTQISQSSSSGSSHRNSWSDWANPANWGMGAASRPWNDQDLSGDDLKYVMWTIVFTKPGYEAVLEPMKSDLVGYSTDSSSYAAVRIAKFLDRARFGKAEKPHAWVEHEYPSTRRFDVKVDSKGGEGSKHETKIETREEQTSKAEQKGWRIPSDDTKYVQFLYRVEWRLPRQHEESTRVERVTVERTSAAHQSV